MRPFRRWDFAPVLTKPSLIVPPARLGEPTPPLRDRMLRDSVREMQRRIFVALTAVLGVSVLAQPSNAVLVIDGDVPEVRRFTAADLAEMPRATVTDPSPDGEQVYEGVWLDQVLLAADVPEGGVLRGKSLTTYILAEASDGYQIVFSLAELSEEFGNVRVLVADRLNGKPLPEGVGPFRLIVPGDQEGGRWVREVERLTVHQLKK